MCCYRKTIVSSASLHHPVTDYSLQYMVQTRMRSESIPVGGGVRTYFYSLWCFSVSLAWLIVFSRTSHLRRAHSFGKHPALANAPFLTSQYRTFGSFSLISADGFFHRIHTIHTAQALSCHQTPLRLFTGTNMV